MPKHKQQRQRKVVREISLDKVLNQGRKLDVVKCKSTEPTTRGRVDDATNASLVCSHSVGQQRRDVYNVIPKGVTRRKAIFVPVVTPEQLPLMPTSPRHAAKLIERGEATPFWKRGIFCIRLNRLVSTETQPIACGVDPGSKKEGYTLKSEHHTYLNLQADAVTWVKQHVETRKTMRKSRRNKKTPCRQPRANRGASKHKDRLPPSTKARWAWKLRVCTWLSKLFPIERFIIEEIKAKTRKGKGGRWNHSFSPLEVGKSWFYTELSKLASVLYLQGYETKELRDAAGLHKTSHKLASSFDAHCVDSWVLANWWVGGHVTPDNTNMLFITPLQFHRRQLHVMNPIKGGYRKPYGGTLSLGLKRGSLVKHPKWGLVYVGGTSNNRVSLYNLQTGKRLTQDAKAEQCTFLAYNSWRVF